jgi:ketosteroid isomerase-like protein
VTVVDPTEPAWLHPAVEAAFNARDVDALVALYVPEACLIEPGGAVAHGLDAIRAVWAGFVALGGTISMTTRYAVAAGEVALLSNAWQFEAPGITFGSVSAEVATRDGDGTWRYLIDNPAGGAQTP